MDSIITTVRQCMQRGGEPLSVIDLIEKDLLGIDQAAWLISMIEQGSSWLVGALPSEAGKTTLMSALLLFCLLYTSPSPRDRQKSRMPSSA